MSDIYRTALNTMKLERQRLDVAIASLEALVGLDGRAPGPAAPEAVRLRGGKRAPTKSGPASTSTVKAAAPASPVGSDTIAARDAAILDRLRKGPADSGDLRKAMPHEPDLTDEQRDSAYRNAMTRLRVKEKIRTAPDGRWRLA